MVIRTVEQLAIVLTTIRNGNASRAADGLNLSRSHISNVIGDLEARVGVPLFERVPGGMRLTPSGEKLLPALEALERAWWDVSQVSRELKAGPDGTVAVSISEGMWNYVVVRRIHSLKQYQNLNFGTSIAIEPETGPTDTITADIAVQVFAPGEQPTKPSDAKTIRLGRVRFEPYAEARFLLSLEERLGRFLDLSEVPLLQHTLHRSDPGFELWNTLFESARGTRFEHQSATGIINHLVAGDGVAMLPTYVRSMIPNVVPVWAGDKRPEDLARPELDLWMVMPARSAPLARVQSVAKLLKAAFLLARRDGDLQS